MLTRPAIVDERDLAKLVSCVFLNAIKFTELGKISLRATLSPKSRSIIINIADTGPGIPEAFIPNLFKAFSREDDSLTRQKDGLGLGLLVAKGLARRIGGDLLCVRSDTAGPQQGTEFELRVPMSCGEAISRGSSPIRASTSRAHTDSSPIPGSWERQKSTSLRRQTTHPKKTATSVTNTPEPSQLVKASSPLVPSTSSRRNSPQKKSSPSRRLSTKKALTFDRNLAKKHPLTILVAEDNRINRKLLVNMLSKLGYLDVYEAENGAEAVQQMAVDRRARKEPTIDVVLMDLWMPTMDGYEATERIFAMEKDRRNKSKPNKDDDDRAKRKRALTILAVSADVTDAALERASEVGMGGFMTKPYKLMDLERLILEYCAGDPCIC
jgi:CheY-like chemotaxis protein